MVGGNGFSLVERRVTTRERGGSGERQRLREGRGSRLTIGSWFASYFRQGDLCMKIGAMVLAVCGVVHAYQAALAKGSIEGQVMNLKAGSPLKKASVQLMTMNPGGGGGRGQMAVRK